MARNGTVPSGPIMGAALAAASCTFFPAASSEAAVALGVTWVDCVVDPVDADRDGLDDACEEAVVRGFEPELVFGVEETAPERIPFWAARPDGDQTLRIFYAISYLADAGDPTLGGASGHDGDSEFIVLRVQYDGAGKWSLVEGYLSGHYDTFCDSGGWFPAESFAYGGALFGPPLVYVAEGKHANYIDLEACDAGGCYQDHCSDEWHETMGIDAGRDLGLFSTPLVDQHDEAGNPEWYWTDVVFCGWTRPDGDARDGCVPVENSYARELVTFEMDWGPVAPSAGFCQSCLGDEDCEDGGRCDGGVCGRACEVEGCPTNSHCEGSGAGQCVPDRACDCVLACEGRTCGGDGCGGTCGACDPGDLCDAAGHCVPEESCVPDCSGRECGDAGCGASCGGCEAGSSCDVSGHCVAGGSEGGAGGGTGGDAAEDDGGSCACTTPAGPSSPWAALGMVALLAMAQVRRQIRER